MRILEGTVRGTLTGRPNRWTVTAEVDGEEYYCFACNPGRLRELFVPGHGVYLRPRATGGRTTHELVAVRVGSQVVPVDTRVPNRLVARALVARRLSEFRGYDHLVAEVPFGHSRLDFYLGGRQPWYVEVKSCTLVSDGVALFPDAPTLRGTRHLLELMRARRRGLGAAMLFVIQRSDARVLRPLDANDPLFGATLRRAHRAGVALVAYGCRFRGRDFDLHRPVPIDLSKADPSD